MQKTQWSERRRIILKKTVQWRMWIKKKYSTREKIHHSCLIKSFLRAGWNETRSIGIGFVSLLPHYLNFSQPTFSSSDFKMEHFLKNKKKETNFFASSWQSNFHIWNFLRKIVSILFLKNAPRLYFVPEQVIILFILILTPEYHPDLIISGTCNFSNLFSIPLFFTSLLLKW